MLHLLCAWPREVLEVAVASASWLSLRGLIYIIVLLFARESLLILVLNVDLLNTSSVRTLEAVIYQAITPFMSPQRFSSHAMFVRLRHSSCLMKGRESSSRCLRVLGLIIVVKILYFSTFARITCGTHAALITHYRKV